MKLKNDICNFPPSVVAELDGKIIFIDRQISASYEGPFVGDNIRNYLMADYTKQKGIIEIIKTKNLPYNTAIVQVSDDGALQTVQVQFWNISNSCPETEECDKKLFNSFGEISNNTDCSIINLKSFISSIIDYIKSDLRYSYRRFEITEITDDIKISSRYIQLSALVVGIISILNEIEYKNPIKIESERAFGQCILRFSVTSNTFITANGAFALAEHNPRVAMRIAYVTAICDKNGIDCSFQALPNSINVTLCLEETEQSEELVRAAVFEMSEVDVLSYAMDLFNYYLFNDTEGEEQE